MTKFKYNYSAEGCMQDSYFTSERIKSLRENSGLTQGQVAGYLGVDQSLVSRFEKNERQLSTDMLDKISGLYGCPIEYLVSENCNYQPLSFALRASNITTDDLESIAMVNKIALNLRKMQELLKVE